MLNSHIVPKLVPELTFLLLILFPYSQHKAEGTYDRLLIICCLAQNHTYQRYFEKQSLNVEWRNHWVTVRRLPKSSLFYNFIKIIRIFSPEYDDKYWVSTLIDAPHLLWLDRNNVTVLDHRIRSYLLRKHTEKLTMEGHLSMERDSQGRQRL